MALTRKGKEEFVREFLGSMEGTILSKLDKVPEYWDGRELKEMIADAFNAERTGLSKSSLREYHNDLLIHNIL